MPRATGLIRHACTCHLLQPRRLFLPSPMGEGGPERWMRLGVQITNPLLGGLPASSVTLARATFSHGEGRRVVEAPTPTGFLILNFPAPDREGYMVFSICSLSLSIIFFSSREMYDWEMPSRSATSFCVSSRPPRRPKRSSMICYSRGGSASTRRFTVILSSVSSSPFDTLSGSEPSTSPTSSSLPSQSTFIGSSSETSAR